MLGNPDRQPEHHHCRPRTSQDGGQNGGHRRKIVVEVYHRTTADHPVAAAQRSAPPPLASHHCSVMTSKSTSAPELLRACAEPTGTGNRWCQSSNSFVLVDVENEAARRTPVKVGTPNRRQTVSGVPMTSSSRECHPHRHHQRRTVLSLPDLMPTRRTDNVDLTASPGDGPPSRRCCSDGATPTSHRPSVDDRCG
jgi:hypothetical protein